MSLTKEDYEEEYKAYEEEKKTQIKKNKHNR